MKQINILQINETENTIRIVNILKEISSINIDTKKVKNRAYSYVLLEINEITEIEKIIKDKKIVGYEVIAITDNIDHSFIWKLINSLNMFDIIFIELSDQEIKERMSEHFI